MSYNERSGDLFEATDLDVIAHGVNCMGVMGAGFALQIAERYPWAKRDYIERCTRGLYPGGLQWSLGRSGFPDIVHLATQNRPGPDAKLRWVAQSVAAMLNTPDDGERIGMPRIGCGIGGLEWAEVRAILVLLGNEFSGELVVFSG